MKKKNLEQLNDAMLEGIEVPESVLDMAREEMRSNQKPVSAPVSAPAIRGKRAKVGVVGDAVALNRNKIITVSACAVCALALAVALFVCLNRGITNSTINGSSYNISQLSASEITSVSRYNQDNGTNYLSPEGAVSYCTLYSDGGAPVLIEQGISCGGHDCVWYVLVNGKDYVDILDSFEDMYGESEINGCAVYYDFGGEIARAKIYYGDSCYCVSSQTEDGQILFDILSAVLS